MFARPCASFAAESALVLEHVMAKLVGENVTEHEAPQRIRWPSYDAVIAQVRSGVLQFCLLVLREGVWKPPWRQRLVVQPYLTRPDEFAEEQSASGARRGDQLD
jgi:hypothetical protein